MKKLALSITLMAVLGLGFIGAHNIDKASASVITDKGTVTTFGDPGTGGRPGNATN